MAYNPGAPVVTRVEINTALGWVDVTARGRAASSVITQGRSANSIQAETSRLQLTLGNPDGYLTEDNAMSPWYGSWGRGCEIRVSRIGLTVSPAERFHGQVDSIVERYPGGNIDATVEVVAIGTLGILAQGSDPLRSPLFRSIAGVSPNDYVPFAYWSGEGGTSGTAISSSLIGGAPMAVAGAATFATSAPPGSLPLPSFEAGSTATAVIPVYADTGRWVVTMAMNVAAAPSATTAYFEILTTGSSIARWTWEIEPGSPDILWRRGYDSTGALITSNSLIVMSGTPDEAAFYGSWTFVTIGAKVNGGNFDVSYGGYNQYGGIGPGTVSVAGAPGMPTTIRMLGAAGGVTAGHWAVYTDPAFSQFSYELYTGPAMFGWTGEAAADRMTRLCREEGVPFELIGTAADTPAMGPQLTDTLLANLRDCENADQGLMHDNGTDGAIGYVTRTHLYNQTATIAVASGSLEPGLEAIRDRQYIRNDVTSTRPDGGSARFADEAHVAKIRARLKDSRQPNVEADDQLPYDASWAVHVGTPPGARYNSVGINLRNADGALLADQVAAHAIGDRLTVAKTALPPQHHIDGIDGLTVGWTEVLDADTWIFRANVTPYQPYIVGVLNDTVLGRLGTGGAAISGANLASTAGVGATFQFTNTDGRLFTTAAGDFDMDVVIGGERIRLSGISGASNPQTGTIRARAVNGVGPKTHLIGAAIQVYQPIVLAL